MRKPFKIELTNCFLKDLTKNLYETKNIVHQPQAQACGFFVCSEIDLLTSTNSFIKRLVANFVGVNKIRVCISILQKHAF